jgi:hypothetical protein
MHKLPGEKQAKALSLLHYRAFAYVHKMQKEF